MPSNPDKPAPFQPSATSLGALAALAVVTALLSLLLWAELLVARAGGATLCALSDPDACARLWNGPFASAIHRFTGLPVAGWGVAWALAAAALPLVALVRAAESRPRAAWLSAVRIAAAGAVVAVFLLAAVALQAKSFCVGCFLAYALTLAYAGIALVGWRPLGLPEAGRGLRLSAAALITAFGLLLYPGLETPSKNDASGRAAVVGATGASGASGASAAAAPSMAPAANDALSKFVVALDPKARQTLADSLYLYRNGIALPLGLPRTLLGAPAAPLRITEFTDIRCDHCAQLHETLAALEREAPARSFAVEPRQFPLDGECNSFIRQSSDPVRCLAARARLCAEGRNGAAAYTARLFGRQETLTVDDVYALAESMMPRRELERCVVSAETARRLQADIALAVQYDLDGTPLVLLNGRKGTSFAPFLYAMILTGGQSDHPAFDSLPPANPSAHLH